MVRKRFERPSPPAPDVPSWDAHWTVGADSKRHWNYWKREALAYEHGVVDAYADSGIVAPRCLRVDEGDDAIELWLEEVHGRPGERWTVGDFATAATALGRSQAKYLTGASVPSFDWLSQHFLREYSSEKPVEFALLDDDEAWHHPLVREHVPVELREAAGEMHLQRHRLYAIAECLPRVFCHLDFWPKNLFLRTNGDIVLIDWGLSGDGCAGEDIGNLVPDTVFDHFLPADVLPELEDAVLHGYLTGMADGGWRGDPALVQLGMWASAVKYDWLTPHLLASATAAKQLAYGGQAEVDAAHRFRERGSALLFTCRRALDALRLADRLGIAT